MAVKWTEEQKKVITLRDRNILVSAAAGSGKTAVLVQRILSKIMDPLKPVDIDRLLIVTFTNAAAAEMNIVCSAAAIRAAEYLKEKFGTPYEIEYPQSCLALHRQLLPRRRVQLQAARR